MTPAARYAAAIGVLDQWLEGQPVEQALTRWARGARYAGSKDRAAVRDHVYDVMRRKGTCAAAGGAKSGRGLVLGLIRIQGDDPATVFTGEGYGPSPLSDEERDQAVPDPDPQRDVSPWVLPHLTARFGVDTNLILNEMSGRAPVWLRVAQRRATVQDAISRLASDGVEVTAHPDLPTALRVTEGARRIRSSGAYTEGWVELQDLSAQLAVARLDWPSRGRILDYCAGGGGKALAIADGSAAQVYAHDALPARMADLQPRAERAGVNIINVDPEGIDKEGEFETVLTDVPCSGSGTWRRDPEAKWRLTPDRLQDLTKVQDAILAKASVHVAPGGRLIYMTCSVFEQENEARIAAFLSQHPEWTCVAQHLDTPLTASDGFFSAELLRV